MRPSQNTGIDTPTLAPTIVTDVGGRVAPVGGDARRGARRPGWRASARAIDSSIVVGSRSIRMSLTGRRCDDRVAEVAVQQVVEVAGRAGPGAGR